MNSQPSHRVEHLLDFDPRALIASALKKGLCSAPKTNAQLTEKQVKRLKYQALKLRGEAQ